MTRLQRWMSLSLVAVTLIGGPIVATEADARGVVDVLCLLRWLACSTEAEQRCGEDQACLDEAMALCDELYQCRP